LKDEVLAELDECAKLLSGVKTRHGLGGDKSGR